MTQVLTVRHLDQPGSHVTAAATEYQHHRIAIIVLTIITDPPFHANFQTKEEEQEQEDFV